MDSQQQPWHETVARARALPPSAAVGAAISELRTCIARLGLLNMAATGAAGPIPGPVAEIIRDSIQGVNRMQQVVDERFLGRVFSLARHVESVAILMAIGVAVLLQGIFRSNQILLMAGLAYVSLIALSAMTGSPSTHISPLW